MRWLSVALLLLCVGCTYRIPFGAVEQPIKAGWESPRRMIIPGHPQRGEIEEIKWSST